MKFLEQLIPSPSETVQLSEGVDVKLYPNRLQVTGDLRLLSKDLGRDFAILFEDRTADSGNSVEFLQDDTGEGSLVNSKNIRQGIPLDVIQFRSKTRSEAIQRVGEVLLGSQTKHTICRLLMDSMRDEFPASACRDKEQVAAFADHDNMTIEIFIPILVGWVKAQGSKAGEMGKKFLKLVEETTDPKPKSSSTIAPEQSEEDGPPTS